MIKAQFIAWGLVLITILLALYLRMWWFSQDEWQRGQEAEKAGKYVEALDHYQYAMRQYAPFLQSNALAAKRLWTLGEQKYKDNQSKEALFAFDRLRGGILATRSFYIPYQEYLEACNQRIATLRAKEQSLWDVSKSEDALKQEHLLLLSSLPGPSSLGSLIITSSFMLWVLFALLSISKGFDAQLKLITPRYLLLCLCFLLLWSISLAIF